MNSNNFDDVDSRLKEVESDISLLSDKVRDITYAIQILIGEVELALSKLRTL